MRDPYMKKLYCLLWCRIIHETIRPKLNYATIYDKCYCTYLFVCEFYSHIFFIYISKPWIFEQLHFDINLSSIYQVWIFWINFVSDFRKHQVKVDYIIFYFKIDNLFSFSKMIHAYIKIAKTSSLHLLG